MRRPAKRADKAAGASPVGLFSERSVDEFLAQYWQRAPLLVRQAFPGIQAPLEPRALMRLAGDDAVQSRLVSSAAGSWTLDHGPFRLKDLPPLGRKNWTLLVQGVNLHDDAAHRLMSAFRFLPDARLDDLMISLAGDQGGVGPHWDSYDVFLVQLWGTRRWQIAPPGEDTLRPDLPLKILERFSPTETWLLEPGDMLYVPPGWAHDGVAQGPCMTASVGFRAPSRQEFLRDFLAEAAYEPGGDDPRFSDQGRAPARNAAQLPDDLHQTLFDWASSWRPSQTDINEFIGRFLTEPAAHVFFDSNDALSATAFGKAAASSGIRLDRRTRMLYRGRMVFINGECHRPTRLRSLSFVCRLADQGRLGPAESERAMRDLEIAALLYEWAQSGWLHPGSAREIATGGPGGGTSKTRGAPRAGARASKPRSS